MRTRFDVLAIVLLIAGLVPAAAQMPGGGGGGGGGSPGAAPRPDLSPERVAERSYQAAQRAQERALAYEAQARESDAKGFLGMGARPSEKAVKQWRKALVAYKGAVASAPDQFYQAHSELCLVYQKLDLYEKALSSAERALDLIPGYAPALECRGRSDLRLGRLREARAAWERLARLDSERARSFLEDMQTWLARVEHDSAEGPAREELDSLREWVGQRTDSAVRQRTDSTGRSAVPVSGPGSR